LSRAWVPSVHGVHALSSPAPPPEDEQVVVAVAAAQLDRAQLYLRSAVPGFAALGRVVAAGARALPLLDQVVLVGSVDPCGQCEVCRRGGGTVCPRASRRGNDARGTLAERVTASARWVVPLSAELGLAQLAEEPAASPRLATLAGDAALAYTMYARSDLSPRDPVVVLGRRPVTRFLVEVLLAKGLAPVVLVEPSEQRDHDAAWLAWLARRGVVAVTRDSADSAEELRGAITAALNQRRAATAGGAAEPDASPPGRPWKLLATEPPSLLVASQLAGPRAAVTVLMPPTATGALVDAAAVEPAAWARELTVLAVSAASPELLLETAALAARGELDLEGGVAVRALEDLAPSALASLDSTLSLVVRVPELTP
jgi:threonine dehydrogenase-like Zn-dependent dehydrogenase